ncbi:DUF4249 family protein [uncultured Dokdonia sp.]|uniref:DUF4249 family protein n=1 Tax=uncultured Dokdonia sp. TaxID=575653 RepID=UPI00260F2395|nr:DUF4249 family protein [uncultured Dokdonia sp.]
MRHIIYILFLATFFTSCEDVVDVDLPAPQPRLVVDALVRLNLEEEASPVRFKVTTTGAFFDEITPTPLTGMQLVNEAIPTVAGIVFLTQDPDHPNEYVPGSDEAGPNPDGVVSNDFFLEGRLILTFTFEEELYLAETRFAPAPPIDMVVQGDQTLFDENDTEVIVTFTDIPEQDNFYVFDFDFNEFLTIEDRFFQGQQFDFSYFYDTDLEAGDVANISILGASESFYNYMDLLIEQSDLTDGGPFQVPVTTVRGNILKVEGVDNINIFDNVGRPQEFVLGYFAVSQEFKTSITIE